MILEDFHVHSTYCDGKNSLEEMVRAAIDLNMTRIGFSGHAYTDFDDTYCMTLEDTQRYAEDIACLKEKYKDKIKILCGLEMDYFSATPTIETDYLLGSVHYVKKGDIYCSVDHSEEVMREGLKTYFNDDIYTYAEIYFSQIGDILRKTNADIIGHFDLVSKFNEGGRLFDTSNERYVAAAKSAIDKLIPYNKPFEVNTGAMSRGYRTAPYPEMQFLKYIREKGGSVILSGDTHQAENLCYNFEECERMLKEMGFENIVF